MLDALCDFACTVTRVSLSHVHPYKTYATWIYENITLCIRCLSLNEMKPCKTNARNPVCHSAYDIL